jgi:hypothetical protein
LILTMQGQPKGTIFQGGNAPAATIRQADIDREGITSVQLYRSVPGSGALDTVPAGSAALSFTDATLAVGSSAYYCHTGRWRPQCLLAHLVHARTAHRDSRAAGSIGAESLSQPNG